MSGVPDTIHGSSIEVHVLSHDSGPQNMHFD